MLSLSIVVHNSRNYCGFWTFSCLENYLTTGSHVPIIVITFACVVLCYKSWPLISWTLCTSLLQSSTIQLSVSHKYRSHVIELNRNHTCEKAMYVRGDLVIHVKLYYLYVPIIKITWVGTHKDVNLPLSWTIIILYIIVSPTRKPSWNHTHLALPEILCKEELYIYIT